MDRTLARRIAVGVAIGAILYLALALYADLDAFQQALGRFRFVYAIPVLLLSLANYAIRFGRWQMYLRAARVALPVGVSLRIFLAGLVMSVTPGKFGEVLKAYLVKMHDGTPVSRTGPIVVAERVTDLVALCVLLFAGSLVYRTQALAVVVSGGLTALLVVALVSPRATHAVLVLVERVRWLRPYGERIERAYESMRTLMRPRRFLAATGLGTLAWFAECLGFALVLHGFDVQVSAGFATFVYAFATLVGALMLVPGGLGGTEATMVAMLLRVGAAKELAAAATFLTRLATLWFAVGIGALVLLAGHRFEVERRQLD